jgi:hypothetical protein
MIGIYSPVNPRNKKRAVWTVSTGENGLSIRLNEQNGVEIASDGQIQIRSGHDHSAICHKTDTKPWYDIRTGT